jgi:hypothetical protein
MADPTSRYDAIETARGTDASGRPVAYRRRRLLPKGQDLPLLAEVVPAGGERLDLLATRTLGDPLAFWRICDANDVMDPLELVDGPPRLVRIPIPQP